MGNNRIMRNLKQEETEPHFHMLNLCFKPWGNKEEWDTKYKRPGMDVTKNVFIVEENGEWIGGVSSWMRDMLVMENRVKVWAGGDAYTHPDHAGKGVYSTTMKGLIRRAQEDGAALLTTFVSSQEIPYTALQKYGYCSILYPATKVRLLRPERLGRLIEGRSSKRLHSLEGAIVRITTEAGVTSFAVKDGVLQRVNQTAGLDVDIRSDMASLFRVYAKSLEGRRALFVVTAKMILTGRLSVRLSLRGVRGVLAGMLSW